MTRAGARWYVTLPAHTRAWSRTTICIIQATKIFSPQSGGLIQTIPSFARSEKLVWPSRRNCIMPTFNLLLWNIRSVLTATLGQPQFWYHPCLFGSLWWKRTGWWIKGDLPDGQLTNMTKPEMLKDEKGRPVNKWHQDTSNLPRLECARRRPCLSRGIAQVIAEQ